MIGSRRRFGRSAALVLSLFLGLLAVESAVHSVHHLFESDGEAGCQVLAASQHLSGIAAPALDLGVHSQPAPGSPPVADRGRRPPFFRTAEERAPPSLLA